MKKILFILSIITFSITAKSQTAEIRIVNASIITGNIIQFDVEIRAASGVIYLGQSDIRINFNENKFATPAISRVSATNTALVASDGGAAAGYYSIGIAKTKTNLISLNLNHSGAPSDATAFQSQAAKINSSFIRISTFRITNFTGSDISDIGLSIRKNNTFIHSVNSSTPFNGTFIPVH